MNPWEVVRTLTRGEMEEVLPPHSVDGFELILRILENILNNLNNLKFRRINLKFLNPNLLPFLTLIGFVPHRDSLLFLPGSGRDAATLRLAMNLIQSRIDSSLDPDSLSLQKISEIVQRDGRLPGIDETINDEVLDGKIELPETPMPKKPWELQFPECMQIHS
jgi:hypothetical protein